MKREIRKDRAGLIPYILYTIYTVYMVMAAVYLKWPSWVAAVVVCGLLASIGLRILLGRSAEFFFQSPRMVGYSLSLANLILAITETTSSSC